LLKRYANADWQPDVRGVAHNSQWLYGLTAAGEARRGLLLQQAIAATGHAAGHNGVEGAGAAGSGGKALEAGAG
jgi:hypothetical protein